VLPELWQREHWCCHQRVCGALPLSPCLKLARERPSQRTVARKTSEIDGELSTRGIEEQVRSRKEHYIARTKDVTRTAT
jgi:hypothetical protein